MTPFRVRDRTAYCNHWEDAKKVSLRELKEIAWVITGDAKRKLGFQRYRDLEDDERKKVEKEIDIGDDRRY